MNTVQLRIGNGLNNKTRVEAVPEGFVRSAVNVDFDSQGKVKARSVPNLIYPGNCHSLWGNFFVEEGDLKQLDGDYTATIIKDGIGDKPVSFCTAAKRTFFSNGITVGSIVGGNYRSWGIERPPRQPDLSESTSGGMFAGTYQIVITWLRSGEESGAIISSEITISDGSGIRLSNFPVPPNGIDTVAVYCSSVNGKELYLYGEFPSAVFEVTINSHISDTPLTTQFCRPPQAFDIIEYHYGRIYGAIDNRVHYSEPHNYGCFAPNSYWVLPNSITGIISVPEAIYLGTTKGIYRVANIDLEGLPIITQIKDYGMVKTLNTAYDTDNEVAYISTTKGLCAVNSEGITEITAKNVAVDEYEQAQLSVVEQNGYKKLIAIHQTVLKHSGLKVA